MAAAKSEETVCEDMIGTMTEAQQQPENSVCCVCQTTENLLMCLICGVVGCGRLKEGHARRHWEETEHCYSLELETQRVWHYAGDNCVHRLIQSKTDGNLVELNSHGSLSKDGCGSCEYSQSRMTTDALLNTKEDMVVPIQAQLENQKQKVSEAPSKAISQRLQELQTRRDICFKEKQILLDLNEILEDAWSIKIREIEERLKEIEKQNEKILGLKRTAWKTRGRNG